MTSRPPAAPEVLSQGPKEAIPEHQSQKSDSVLPVDFCVTLSPSNKWG